MKPRRMKKMDKYRLVPVPITRRPAVPPLHKHRLEPTIKGEEVLIVYCGACEGEISGQMYWCDICEFCFHEWCANLPPEIETFFHPCPLVLYVSPGFLCNCCFRRHTGIFRFRCNGCDFDMDVGCVRKALSLTITEEERDHEQVLHCCHPHPLQPLPFETETKSPCQICDMVCSSPPLWGCQPCNFHVHKFCLDFLPQKIKSNLHYEAASWVLKASPSELCIDCEQEIVSTLVFYKSGGGQFQRLCISCCLARKMVEESCLQVPRVINHFFHPCPLKLKFSPFSTCQCFGNHHSHNFSYHCKPCDFFLNFDCAQIPRVSHQEETNKIQHFCHWHPLKCIVDTIDGKTFCKLCESSHLESFYGCSQCQFYIHKSCMDILPQQITHPLLNQTMVLLPVISFNCTTCSRVCSELTFRCIESQCKFCVKCILWPTKNGFDSSGRFKSIHHWHQLTTGDVDESCCFMCEEYCSGSTYHCKECNIFFHKSCIELPVQLQQHPIHPHHPLTLTFESKSQKFRCNLCLKNLPTHHYTGIYRCEECLFHLDTRCASLLASIKYGGHPHLLCVVEILHAWRQCSLCNSNCKGPVLRCVECNFNLHLQCGPLPYTIKHACHVHPLVVQDYYVEDNATDEFPCHVCEKRRDPRERIYQCVEGCLMICEVKCVLSEVVASLQGKHGVIELDNVYPKIVCKLITKDLVFAEITRANKGGKDENVTITTNFEELFKSICSDSEWNEFKEELNKTGLFKAMKRIIKILAPSTYIEEDANEFTSNKIYNLNTNVLSLDGNYWSPSDDDTMYSYSRKAFEDFNNILDLYPSDDDRDDDDEYIMDMYARRGSSMQHVYVLPNTPSTMDHGSRIARYYKLPNFLNSVCEDFFGNYDVFGPAWSRLDYNRKRCIVFIICSILHKMHMTKVVKVPRERICKWLHIFKSLEEMGGGMVLKLDFLVKHIKRIGKAHFVIQSRDIVDHKSLTFHKEIEKLSTRRQELTQELKVTEMKLQQKKKDWEEHRAYRAAGANELKWEYFNALQIKWRPCYEFSTDYSRRA